MHEAVGDGDVMEGALLLVPEEGVWHPDLLHQLGVQLQPLGPRVVDELQAGVDPALAEVDVEGVVLSATETRG